jgi:hypothetical protein
MPGPCAGSAADRTPERERSPRPCDALLAPAARAARGQSPAPLAEQPEDRRPDRGAHSSPYRHFADPLPVRDITGVRDTTGKYF